MIEEARGMGEKDYYSVMGLGPDASEEEIKKAYRKLVMQYHPDRNRNNPEAVETLKGINEAYHVLGDRERKSAYDRSLRGWTDALPFRTYADETDLESFLSSLSAKAHFGFRGKGFCRRGGRGRCGRKNRKGIFEQ
jgi:curved DNA-binding protein CbpA